MKLNDFKELANVNLLFDKKRTKNAVRQKSSKDYNDVKEVVLERDKERENTFGYTHILHSEDIRALKMLKYIGYEVEFDNKARRTYIRKKGMQKWEQVLKNGFITIRYKDYENQNRVKLMSKLLFQDENGDNEISSLINMAEKMERTGVFDNDCLKKIPIFVREMTTDKV